jgi:hypothetical protein
VSRAGAPSFSLRWCPPAANRGFASSTKCPTVASGLTPSAFETTAGTDADEPGAALAAKPAVRRILGGASRTAHPARSLFQMSRPSGDRTTVYPGDPRCQKRRGLSPHSGALCNRTRHPADPSMRVFSCGSPQAGLLASRLVATRGTPMTQHRAEQGHRAQFGSGRDFR